MNIDQHYEIDETRSWNIGSFWDQLFYALKKLTNYGEGHGILLSLPQWSNNISPVSVIDEEDVSQVLNEDKYKYLT